MSSPISKILSIFLALGLLLIGGTLGYVFLTDMSFFDALYMTVITISTVGFQEVAPLGMAGRLFTILLVFAGFGTVAYALSSVATFVLEGELRKVIRRRNMENKISNISDHFILCGAGQTGMIIVEQFRRRNAPFLVVEDDELKVEELLRENIPAIAGDATHEETLATARIDKAKGLIACLATDAENVFTVLTAREMNPDLYIVARAIERSAHSKLRKAGANNTISPNEIGGTRMAALVLNPAVVSFVDVITRVEDVDFDLEEVRICHGSGLIGKSLRETQIREKTGLIVLAIKKTGEDRLHFNPGVQEVLAESDKMLVLGKSDQIRTLRQLACDPNP